MFAYIGRQAIYNTVFNIAGYELLYRRNSESGGAARNMDGDEMTKSVLSDAVNVFGIKNLTNGLPAYINFTRNLILEDFALLFDPNEIVIEVPGDVFVNDALAGKLSDLQRSGYRLSLNSYNVFNGRIRFDQIIDTFDVIRLDISQHNRLQLRDVFQRLRYSRAQFLAEKVETEQDFELVRSLKFSLFQGYYFEKPDCLSKQITLTSSPFGRLLVELMRPYPNFEMCCRIVESDTMLTHLFLRWVLKVRYNRGNISAEIRRSMALLGVDGLRQWTSAQFLKQVNTTNSDELARQAFLRGRFVEQLMKNTDTDASPEQGFFMGMISLMDHLTGLPLDSLLSELKLVPEAEAALRGEPGNEYSAFLQYAIAYEMRSGRARFPDIGLSMNGRQVSNLYMECMAETDKAFSEVDDSDVVVYRGNL